jgi:hypothetical protein
MPKTSLVHAQKVLTQAHKLASRAREKNKTVLNTALQRGALVATSAVTAELEQHIPVVVACVPSKLWLAALGYGVAFFAGGRVARVAIGAADAFASVYSYKAACQVRSKCPSPMVAGGSTGYIEEQ